MVLKSLSDNALPDNASPDDTWPDDAWPGRDRRIALQTQLAEKLVDATEQVQKGAVAPQTTLTEIHSALAAFDFEKPMACDSATGRVIDLLKTSNVHMMHSGYFGLFNPSTLFPGVLADQITAAFNPQLAVWSHAPAAVEIERHTITAIAGLFAWSADEADGHFTSGGAEANYTSVLMALTRAFPEFADKGARALPGQPRLYVSVESHLAWLKIAHQVGIGRDSVVLISTDGMGRMDPVALTAAIEKDRRDGLYPFYLGATAGTTNAGMIDPLKESGKIAQDAGLWFHVDAAWGGAAMLSPRIADKLAGAEDADSITLDAHKWFAVPMGAGMFLCRDTVLLAETFRVSASYMPEATESVIDPYTHSLQWSRRFIGLKLFLTLAILGWDGYRIHVERGLDLSDKLAELLRENGWRIVNDSPLAVLCFVDAENAADPVAIAKHVVAEGQAWISSAKFEGRPVLRACITSHLTTEADLTTLIKVLEEARLAVGVAEGVNKEL